MRNLLFRWRRHRLDSDVSNLHNELLNQMREMHVQIAAARGQHNGLERALIQETELPRQKALAREIAIIERRVASLLMQKQALQQRCGALDQLQRSLREDSHAATLLGTMQNLAELDCFEATDTTSHSFDRQYDATMARLASYVGRGPQASPPPQAGRPAVSSSNRGLPP